MVNRADALNINTDDLVDESDHAAAIIQQSVSLNVQERDRWLLKEIEHALSKFEEGTYGLCEDTEEPIDEGRLNAAPYTRYCVEAAEMRERQAKKFARVGG
jgi:DnaK suppressor protein